MDEKDLKSVAASADWLASVGQLDLARRLAFQALLELKRSAPQEKSESLREIEAALKKTYVSDDRKIEVAPEKSRATEGRASEMPGFQARNDYMNIMIETALKTIAVLAAVFAVFTVVGLVTNVGDKHYKMITKIEKGHDRRWNQIEGALSRNPYLYYRAALLYEERDEFDKAIFQMEKAVSLAPDEERYTRKLDALRALYEEQKRTLREKN